MKKLLNFTDWLLLGIGGYMDFMQIVKDPFNLVKTYYQNFYGYVPDSWKQHNFLQIYWRNLKTGRIQKVVQNGEVFLELTSSGREKIKRRFPFVHFQRQSWDKKWRLAIFDIEEASRWMRDRFRQKLKELGFAQLQKSVWITPYDFLGDLREFLKTYRLSERVILIETENFFIEDVKALAARLWHLSEINHYYKEIYEDIRGLKTAKNKRKKKQQLIQIRQRIIITLLHDPHLPKEMLPDEWWGNNLKELIEKRKIFEAKTVY